MPDLGDSLFELEQQRLTNGGQSLRVQDDALKLCAAAAALPLYAEGAGLLLAILSVVAPPVGPIAVALLLWLLFAGRRREGQKYAGLRILK